MSVFREQMDHPVETDRGGVYNWKVVCLRRKGGRGWAKCTVLVLSMAHRTWKETKQLTSMLPGPAVPGSCLVSFHIRWAILSTSTVHFTMSQ